VNTQLPASGVGVRVERRAGKRRGWLQRPWAWAVWVPVTWGVAMGNMFFLMRVGEWPRWAATAGGIGALVVWTMWALQRGWFSE
jgi:hypothetical protein